MTFPANPWKAANTTIQEPRGPIYTTIMELGPERPFLLWFWGPPGKEPLEPEKGSLNSEDQNPNPYNPTLTLKPTLYYTPNSYGNTSPISDMKRWKKEPDRPQNHAYLNPEIYLKL